MKEPDVICPAYSHVTKCSTVARHTYSVVQPEVMLVYMVHQCECLLRLVCNSSSLCAHMMLHAPVAIVTLCIPKQP